MIKLSLYSMIFNEDKYIKNMLDDVYAFFDEIVILDGKSKDKTIEIIKNYNDYDKKIRLFIKEQQGVRYETTWEQPSRRTFAMKRCTGDWIFMIDADETLQDNLKINLKYLINQGKYIAYSFPRYNLWKEKNKYRADKNWYPDFQFRLWKNLKDCWSYEDKARHCELLFNNKKIHSVRNSLHLRAEDKHIIHWHYTDNKYLEADDKNTIINDLPEGVIK